MAGFILANDSRVNVSMSQEVRTNRLILPVVNIDPTVLDIVMPPENEGLGTTIFNTFNSQLYILSRGLVGKFWSSANPNSDYESLKARYNTVRLRISAALRGRTIPDPSNSDLISTSWTDGIVRWLIRTDPSLNLDITPMWRRIRNGVEYPHELSLDQPPFDPLQIPAVFQEGVTREVIPISLASSQVFNPTFDASGILQTWFSQQIPGYLTWDNPTGPQVDGMQTATIDASATPNWVCLMQSPTESEALFLQRTLGTAAQPFLVKTPTTIGTNTSTISLTTVHNWYPKIDETSGPNDFGNVNFTMNVNPGPSDFHIETGRILFSPEIAMDPSLNVTEYSLWIDPTNSIDDSVLVPLPSTVIYFTDANTETQIFNNIPNAIVRNFDYRNYIRPITTNGLPFINYCKLTSTNALGFGFHRFTVSPNSSVWYFWNPGMSLWMLGPRSGNPANMYFFGPDSGRIFNTRGVGVVLDSYIWGPPPAGTKPQDIITTPQISTQIIGEIVDRSGGPFMPGLFFPDVAGQLTASIATGFSGPSIGADTIIFVSLAGDDGNLAWRDAETFPAKAFTVQFAFFPDVAFYTLMITGINVPSTQFTKNTLDATTFTIPASGAIIPRLFDYGSFSFNAVDVSGSIRTLMPPPFYLTINQGITPDIISLQSRLNTIDATITQFIVPAINALITSIDQIGFTSELISQRVYRLEQGVKIRLDQLSNSILNVARALSDFMNITTGNFTDEFGDDLSGQFVSFLLDEGPKLATLVFQFVGVDENAINLVMMTSDEAFGVMNDRYRSLYIANSINAFITRAMQFAQSGDIDSAVVNGMMGLVQYDMFRSNFTISGGMGTFDNQTMSLGMDGTSFLSPEIQQYLQTMDPGTANRTLLEATTENVGSLTQQASSLLLQLNALGAQLGIPPVSQYDVNVF